MKIQYRGWMALGLLAAALFLASAAPAQGPATAMGKVTLDGKPVKDVVVVFKGLDSERLLDGKTDKNGEYLLRLMSGRYEITVKIDGKETAKKEVTVRGGAYGELGPTFRNQFDFPILTSAKNPEAAKQQAESDKKRTAYEHAASLNQAGKYEEALAELIPLAEADPNQQDPNQWLINAQMGVAYQGLKRYPEAEASLKKAIELNPQNGVLYITLGQVYVKQGRKDEARQMFETAAQLSPEDAATSFYNIGVTFYNSNDLKSAIEPLRKATELDPNRADAYYLLGMCLFGQAESKQEGQETKIIPVPGTQEAFQRYLELAPNGAHAEEAKAALQALGTSVPTSVRVRKK